MTILVTGGAGYIGSHTVRHLQRSGHPVLVLDNLVYGHRDIAEQVLAVPLVVGQLGDRGLLDRLLQGSHPLLPAGAVRAVLHFAAYAYVGESVADPARYYRNNLGDTLVLLEALRAESQRRGSPIPLVFSSTCATYGIPEPDQIPIRETTPQQPINPYGRSKWMVEQLLADFAAAYGQPSVIFRYFNAAGADPAGDLGEDHTPETHLIPLVLEALAGRRPAIQVYGRDYPTPDGTCIRDYIHVSDLAAAHGLGLQRLLDGSSEHGSPEPVSAAPTVSAAGPLVYNLGTGHGYSVQEVIEAARQVTGRELTVQDGPRRPGDPAELVADAGRAQAELGWSPQRSDLPTILADAWAWHQRRWS
ncbi:UDP-glucose 4-epimerase GalE [Cyanobium sp. CH-040]|uniref:UDP-glucose 4-epimerase GalE n=1 Tax=Cyanobium sp. CH-040 TaxID=2823708 RepID=UPI0020CC38DA|nr:UDP-glucose 4-epimerase GalE [Cyanobium sp. CH-040]MCP9926543.1 UDP-glucose 4-epimerase GalE [Cyanobium sp. CH-040]